MNRTDCSEILRAMGAYLPAGRITEIRALDATAPGERYQQTFSGYFDDPQALADAVAKLTSARAVYFAPNEIDPSLLARAANRLRPVKKEPTTADADVLRRRWLLIDCDPCRASGISATDAEHAAAIALAECIRDDLTLEGWHPPILADSGNGAHLTYLIDLPADDGGLIERCLKALAAKYDTAAVHIDTGVFNPARIWKLPGTLACKGDNTPERPHRMAKLLYVPAKLTPIPQFMLEQLPEQGPQSQAAPQGNQTRNANGRGAFDVEAWIRTHSLNVHEREAYKGGHRWRFKACPWNESHTDGSAFLLRLPSGALSAGCHHNGCAGKDWHALRDLIEPGWRNQSGASTGHTFNELRNANRRAFHRGGDAGQSADAGPVLVCMADVEARAVQWLWAGRIPLGRIALLVGKPGEGKSFLTTDMAARVTTGTPWPDGSDCPDGSVILISAEDDPGDTIRPRLDAHRADCRRVHHLSMVRRVDDKGEKYDALFTLADLPALEAALKMRPDCKLVIVDPIGSFLGGKVDAHRDNEVRGVLAPIARLAEKYGAAVLVVAHRRKGTGTSSADDLALGSRAFTGIARAVWHLSRDPKNKARRLLLPGKNNLAPEGTGLAFTIGGDPASIAWERDAVELSADDGLAAENADDDRPGPDPEARHAAAEWLGKLLAGGEVDAATVKSESQAAGLAWRTVQRAADSLEVIREKNAFHGGWQWRLPKPGTEDANRRCQVPKETENLASWHLRKNSGENGDSVCQVTEDAKLNDLGIFGENGHADARPGDEL